MTYPPQIFPTAMPSSADSLANRFLSLAHEPPKTTPDGFGPSSSESFAMFDPDTSSWKTSQGSLLPEWETFSETWPRSGMTRNGKAFRLPRLVPHISAGESSSWPTPTVGDADGGRTTSKGKLFPTSLNAAVRGMNPKYWPTPVAQDDNKTPEAHMAMKARMKGGPRKTPTSLQVVVKGIERGLWPTPTAGDAKSSGSRNTPDSKAHPGISLTDAVRGDGGTGRIWPTPKSTPSGPDYARANRPDSGADDLATAVARENPGQLNPTWVEWLMGFPEGWTDLED